MSSGGVWKAPAERMRRALSGLYELAIYRVALYLQRLSTHRKWCFLVLPISIANMEVDYSEIFDDALELVEDYAASEDGVRKAEANKFISIRLRNKDVTQPETRAMDTWFKLKRAANGEYIRLHPD